MNCGNLFVHENQYPSGPQAALQRHKSVSKITSWGSGGACFLQKGKIHSAHSTTAGL